MFTAVDDVAGEAAEAEGETAGEIEEGAGGEESGAEDEEGAAEGAGGVHVVEFNRWWGGGLRARIVLWCGSVEILRRPPGGSG